MAKNPNRPLSPHLQIYRWSPQMAVSIFHRATGFVMATAGMMTLLWWLSAIGGGADSYATFQKYVVSAGEGATTFQTVKAQPLSRRSATGFSVFLHWLLPSAFSSIWRRGFVTSFSTLGQAIR